MRRDLGLTIAISTLDGRLPKAAPPPPYTGMTYLLVIQHEGLGPRALPPHWQRDDISSLWQRGTGVARSRNLALAHCRTPLLLFYDDDMVPDANGIRTLAETLQKTPTLDFVTGRRDGVAGRSWRARPHRLRLWNSARTATPELMIRVAAFRAAGLAFDPEFGLGAEVPIGDEFVFIADALRAGLKGRHIPVATGWHAGPSTGDDWRDPALLAARARVMRRVFGPLGGLARGVLSVRHRRKFARAGDAVRFALGLPPRPRPRLRGRKAPSGRLT
ncbi:MAG: glycosyltransferase [Paracoccaceae bacterium]